MKKSQVVALVASFRSWKALFLIGLLMVGFALLPFPPAHAGGKVRQTFSGRWIVVDTKGYVHNYTASSYSWETWTGGYLAIYQGSQLVALFPPTSYIGIEPYNTSVTKLP